MERTPTTPVGRRLGSLPQISHRLRVILISLGMLAMIVGVVVALALAIASLPHDNSVTPVNLPDVVISELSIPVEIDAVIDEPIVMPIPVVEEVESPSLQDSIVEPVTEPSFPFSQMKVEWNALSADNIETDVPPRGEKPLSGTIIVLDLPGNHLPQAGNTHERITWFREMLPEVDLNGTIVAATQDNKTFFALVNHEWTIEWRQLFLSRDEGMRWSEINMPADWAEGIAVEIRVQEERDGSVTLFIGARGNKWWTTTVR